MKKKMIFSFGVVAVIGMSMWALVFGVIGGSGPAHGRDSQ